MYQGPRGSKLADLRDATQREPNVAPYRVALAAALRAADAARAEKYDTKKEIAAAMKTASDRVLAESWIGEKISNDVNDAAIEKAYKTFVADTASREQVTAAHILVATKDEAKAIITSLKEGADFAELAKSKSTGPSGPNGGSLGKFGRGQMVPAFENAAFALYISTAPSWPILFPSHVSISKFLS